MENILHVNLKKVIKIIFRIVSVNYNYFTSLNYSFTFLKRNYSYRDMLFHNINYNISKQINNA